MTIQFIDFEQVIQQYLIGLTGSDLFALVGDRVFVGTPEPMTHPLRETDLSLSDNGAGGVPENGAPVTVVSLDFTSRAIDPYDAKEPLRALTDIFIGQDDPSRHSHHQEIVIPSGRSAGSYLIIAAESVGTITLLPSQRHEYTTAHAIFNLTMVNHSH